MSLSRLGHCNLNIFSYDNAFDDLINAGRFLILTSRREFALLAGSPTIVNHILVMNQPVYYTQCFLMKRKHHMSKIGDWIIEQEQNGEIYYDEWKQRYVANRERPNAIRLQDEAGELAREHHGDACADERRTKFFPAN
tara:strand:+ start:73 stop:486 length:414 start_codon:yes stop_codon:yes gene_type:complete